MADIKEPEFQHLDNSTNLTRDEQLGEEIFEKERKYTLWQAVKVHKRIAIGCLFATATSRASEISPMRLRGPIQYHYRERHEPPECNHYDDDRTFYGSEALDQHNTAKHSRQCKNCTRVFATAEALRNHTSAAHNLTCTECGQFYKHKSQFDKHFISPFHAEAIRLHNSTNLESCGRVSASQTALYQHQITAPSHVGAQETASEVVAECSACSLTFVNHRALNQHLAMSSVHQNHDYSTRDMRPNYPNPPSRSMTRIQGHTCSHLYRRRPFNVTTTRCPSEASSSSRPTPRSCTLVDVPD